jgi:hypothetical protein
MILTTPDLYWIWIAARNGKAREYTNDQDFWGHHGKFVITGTKKYIRDLAFLLDPWVEKRVIDAAKYTKKDPETDPLPHIKEFALCIYADDRELEDTSWFLYSLGIRKFEWKYDRESIEDWSENGKLAKEAANYGRTIDPFHY